MDRSGYQDVSAVLAQGVYVLLLRGQAVFVGKAKGPALLKLYGHRTSEGMPAWFPAKGFVFDQILVRTCSVEDLDRAYAEAVAEFKPTHGKEAA